MSRSIHAGVFAMLAAAVTILALRPAGAQDVQAQALCARTGDNDTVRPIPASLVQRASELFGISNTPAAFIQKSTSFRCMGGKVWLCNTGANLECGKANTSRISAGAKNFCKQNPGSDIVPMAATGHDTIYEWKCEGKKAVITKAFATVDPRGFIASNWKPLE